MLEDFRPANIKLGKQLGKGSFGAVIKGSCAGETWAIKIIQLHREGDVEQSCKEALIMRRFESHESVPKAVGYFCVPQNQEAWILMEYIDGYSLSKLSRNPAPLPISLRQKLRLSHQLWDALCFIHRHFGAHKDLHSGNILVTRDLSRAVIIDYGRAALYGSQKDMCSLESTRFAQGSPYFTAPEILRESKRHPVKSDVYSLGISLGGFYADSFFWSSEDGSTFLPLMTVITTISRGQSPERLPVWTRIPNPVRNLVQSAIEFEVKCRSSAEEMLAETEKLLNGKGLGKERAEKKPQRNRSKLPEASTTNNNAFRGADSPKPGTYDCILVIFSRAKAQFCIFLRRVFS